MAESSFSVLHDGQSYKVYPSADWLFRYTVTYPSGTVLTVTSTLWGARRAIKRAIKQQGKNRSWWEAEPVLRVSE